ncbi:MAG: 6-carboxytetrahydropterin synthase QueD, partial [Thiovulaceae bacterium]|nr:6-carboxytetrahydropterin synthase QueD [Sulfurimonadaceae bacterium]
LNSVIVHETDTGYAQGFKEDAYNEAMGIIDLDRIIFSPTIRSDWHDEKLWEKLKSGEVFTNPDTV